MITNFHAFWALTKDDAVAKSLNPQSFMRSSKGGSSALSMNVLDHLVWEGSLQSQFSNLVPR